MIKDPKTALLCYHCGEPCETEKIISQEKHFCCQGCKTVYEILNKVELCDYYSISQNPGINQRVAVRPDKFSFLDDIALQEKLIQYKSDKQSHVTLYLPQMHCSSCIWLLEHLGRLDKNIVRSQVNFLKKEITIVFDHGSISLRKIAELLASIGYEPHFSLHSVAEKRTTTYDKSRIYKIGITGFCFGNIMLLSFPEYFSLGHIEEKGLKDLFSYLNLALALPVFFYGASGFFISAWKGIRQRFLNIDAPIALAIIITFVRSAFEILNQTGAGYLDSMSGIVFFMLLGRYFQDKTYNTLAFNRDYTSYFPLGITLIAEDGREKQIPVSELKTGQRIKVYSNEIIPADCILFRGKALIDYSFVSGEALPVEKSIGEIIYAGGRQLEGALELETVKDVSQSYLTQLWNNSAFRKKEENNDASYIHKLSRYFTLILFGVAAITAVYWSLNDVTMLWNAVTAILIVACPCALLLSATFTNGNMLRVLQKFGFYARNAGVIEQISKADTLVFDKTGTITEQQKSTIVYEGETLHPSTAQLIRSLAAQSAHPLSRAILQSLPFSKTLPVKNFEDHAGLGLEGTVDDRRVRIGSASFVDKTGHSTGSDGSRVYISLEGIVHGCFVIRTKYREGLSPVLKKLTARYDLSLLSGDNDTEQHKLWPLFNSRLLFYQSPQDKLDYIKQLQKNDRKVIMIGDGLNDAGALKQSDVGIAVTDSINNFSPACDAIMDGKAFSYLDELLRYCKKNKPIINGSFVVSILYNIAGLYFAVQGQLQPVVAAILMPVSSISIVLFTTGMSSFFSIRLNKAAKQKTGKNPKTDINHIPG